MFRNAFDGTDERLGEQGLPAFGWKDQASHRRNFLHFCKIVMVMLD
jgi:hypothetical protein